MKRMAFIDLSNFTDWPMGGMIRYELQILSELAEFYDIDLWGVSVDGICPEPVQVMGRKYPVHIFTDAKKKNRLIPNYWKGLAIGKYRKELQKYEIIYIHTGSCAVAAALGRKRKNQLLVYHQHGLQYLDDYSLKTLLQRPFMYLAQRMTDFSFVVTGKDELQEYAGQKKWSDKLVQIGSPVENRIEDMAGKSYNSGNEKKGNVFIYTGRLSAIKRVPMLVEAFSLFCRRNSDDCRLFIVGDGEEREKVRRAVSQYGLEDKVIFTGAVGKPEVQDYLEKSDFYVTASAGEGVSVAILESFRKGIPVACFPVRGLKEQVTDKVTGAVALDETADALADAMERLLATAAAMRENCIEECRKYSAEVIAGKIMEEIESRYEAKNNQHHYTSV